MPRKSTHRLTTNSPVGEPFSATPASPFSRTGAIFLNYPRVGAMQHLCCYDYCSPTRPNSMANRRSNEDARFTFLDDAYRTAFRNWAENVQCVKASQQFRVSRHLEDAEETRTSEEFIYRENRNRLAEFMLDRRKSTVRPFPRRSLDGQNEPFGEAASRAVLKSCDCH
jgi:hypothetical protein